MRWQLLKYKHVTTSHPQHCPYSPEPKKNGSEAQTPLSIDTLRPFGDKEIKAVQKIVGSILYYAQAVDMTVLMALSTIASKQTKGTERTMEKALQVLDYLATHPDATIWFCVTDMVMNIHSDASQQSLWTLFPGVATCRRKTHTLKWSLSHAMFNPAFCCGIRCRGRIRSIIFKLPRRNVFLTHTQRPGPPTTQNPHPLRQRNRHRDCQ